MFKFLCDERKGFVDSHEVVGVGVKRIAVFIGVNVAFVRIRFFVKVARPAKVLFVYRKFLFDGFALRSRGK